MVTASNTSEHHPLPKKPLQIKQDDKFYSRLLSKENTNSFRVYYGVASAGSVPFLWESQPGTPKKSFNDSTLPPLTPPPSYYLNSKKKPNKKHPFSSSKSMFPRLISLKKTHVSASSFSSPVPSLSSSSSISSFTSSLSSSSTPTTPSYNNFRKRNRFSSPRSSFDSSRVDYDQDHGDFDSPTSILCFGVGRNGGGNDDDDGIRGCYSMMTMKRALLSIIGSGHGSGRGAGVSVQGTVASA